MIKKREINVIAICFCAVLLLYMIPAVVTFLTRQICVKHYRMNNEFVKFVYSRDATLLREAQKYATGNDSKTIDWEELYPFCENSEIIDTGASEISEISTNGQSYIGKYIERVESFKKDITNYVEDYHPLQIYMKWISGGYNRLTMGKKAALEREGLCIARDKWMYGYSDSSQLRYTDEEIDEIADSVEDFYAFLKTKDIGFIYVAIGTKPCPYDEEVLGSFSGKDSNKELFLAELDKRGIPEYDLGKMMSHNPEEWYKNYYYTDNHWNDHAGLWAAGILAGYLNENHGFSFNLEMFEEKSYDRETRKDYFVGQQGRKVGPFLSEHEEYTRFIPKFDTKYKATLYSAEYGVTEKQGDLIEVFFNNDLYNEMAFWSEEDYYDQSKGDFRFIENEDVYTFINERPLDNGDKKILIIRDSFASYMVPYISADIGEVDLIFKPKFNGSIRTFVEESEPDAVIMLLFNGNIATKERASAGNGFHFDLR